MQNQKKIINIENQQINQINVNINVYDNGKEKLELIDNKTIVNAINKGIGISHITNIIESIYLNPNLPKYQNDPDVVLASVQNFWTMLKYASPELQDNEMIVIAAVTEFYYALGHASVGMKNNKEVVTAAVTAPHKGRFPSHNAFIHASSTLKNDTKYVDYLASLVGEDIRRYTKR